MSRSTELYLEILGYLDEAAEYFDQYADCEILSESGYHPNREMVLRTGADMCKSLLRDLCKAMADEELERLDKAFAKLAPVELAS